MPPIAVIGSGPSGLAAAKALLEHGLEPLLLEATDSVGGMWAGPSRGAWSSAARTNLSCYSCAFSDFPWPAGSQVFPIRNDVARYLTDYADTFGVGPHVSHGTTVDLVTMEAPHRFRIDYRRGGRAASEVFENVVVASGFFSRPFIPRFEGIERFKGPLYHSADCDTVEKVLALGSDKRVLVIGAAFSGTEIANLLLDYAASVCVTLRTPMWFVPRWVTLDRGETHYPLDLVIYSRARTNPLTCDPYRFLAEIGGDPGDASPELAFDPGIEPPLTMVISDLFLNHVADGMIQTKRSLTLRFDETGVTFTDGSRQEIDVIIACTGYTTTLPFLSPDILTTLAFHPGEQFMPTLMHRHVFHPDLPGLAFVGLYRGPYFPVMELQAQWIAGTIAGALPTPSRDAMLAGVAEERRLRDLVPRPQFPHGDFVSLADGLARTIGVFPALPDSDPMSDYIANGPVVPAHFRLVGPYAKRDLAEQTIRLTPAPLMMRVGA